MAMLWTRGDGLDGGSVVCTVMGCSWVQAVWAMAPTMRGAPPKHTLYGSFTIQRMED